MKKFKDIRVLTVCAMLLAISAIFGFFKIPLSDVAEIRLQFLPVACAGMLFGAPAGALVGGLSDILCYIVKPTGPFFPGFTISSIIQGMIYGFILYNKPLSLKRVIMAQIADTVVISLILNPVWLMILYNNAFGVIFVSRLVKVAVMLPINTVLLMGVLSVVRRIPVYGTQVVTVEKEPETGNSYDDKKDIKDIPQ